MSGLGLIAPAFLAMSALAIPILLLYMLRLRRTDHQISSTFLWQQLVRDREANAPWQKLRPNFLLFLQLLILAALVLALARPFQEVETITTGRIALLIDGSASMNATDMSDGQTRFEAAKDLALETVDTLGSDDTMTVIRVSEVPEVLAAASRDRNILRGAIRDAEPSQGVADWNAALTLAAAGSRGVDELQVVVLSDGGLPPNLPEIPGELRFVEVGEDQANVGIVALSTRALPNEPPQLFAQLENFGEEATRVILEIYLDGEFFSSQFYDIPALDILNVVETDLPEDFNTLEARLSRPASEPIPDYLPVDDVAYTVNAEASSGNILVVTEGNIFIERAFENLAGFELATSDPTRGVLSGEYDLIVLDSWLPDGLPTETDLFIINPPTSTSLFDVTGTSTDSAIDPLTGGTLTDDDRTRFLDFTNVAVREFSTLENIGWADTLVETEDGLPLVIAGENDGQQLAVMSFALQDSNLPLQLPWPILVAGLMEWYQPQRPINVTSIAPGEALNIRPTVNADEVIVETPGGERVNIPLDAPEIFFAQTSTPGLYNLDIRLEGDTVQQDTFAVNLFSRSESNIRPVPELTIATNAGETIIASSGQDETGRRELWTWLVLIGIGILVFEWWYYHRTISRKPKMTGILQGAQGQRGQNTSRRWWQTLFNRR
jgi:Ca-activated chloride channel homolog